MTAALASAGVQYGTITVGSGSTTGTAAISAMGSGGFLLMDGLNASQAGTSEAQSSCTLSISGTTLTATRQTGGTNTVTTPFVAVDGDTINLIKSVQFGSVSFVGGSSTGNATISSVTTGNTAVAHLGMFSTQTSVSLNLGWPLWAVASATAISMTTNTSGGVLTGQFCAIEFQGAALVSLQYVADTAAPSATTRTHTITAVTLANVLSIYAGQWSSSTTASSQEQYGQLTATTTLTIGTNSAGFVSISYATFIVELAAALVETGAQRGLITQTAAASATAAISSVNTAHAILTYNGNKTNASNWNGIVSSLSLTSSILVTANSGTTTTNSTSYEVIALNSADAAAAFVNFMASFDAQVKAPPNAAQFSFVAQIVNPQPIAQNKFYPDFDPQVKAPPNAAQYSTPVAALLPTPITINRFYPSYEAQVKPWPLRAQHTIQFDEKVLPQPVVQNNYYCFFDPQVKPWPLRAQHSFVAQIINPQPIPLNSWYPNYDPQVKPAPPRVSYYAQLLPTPPTPVVVLNFFPVYDAQVKPAPGRSQFTLFSELLAPPLAFNNWYPAYEAQVKPAPRAAQFSTFSETLAGPITINKFYPVYSADVRAFPLNNPNHYAPPTPVIPAVFAPIGWYPSYAAEVVYPPPRAMFSAYCQQLAAPIVPNNWYPQYPDNVNAAPSAARFSMGVKPLDLIFTPVPPPSTISHPEIYGAPHFKKRKRWFDRPQKDILPELDWFEDQQKKKAEFNDFIRDILDPPPQVEQEPEQIITDAASAVSAAKKEEPDNHEIELLLLLGL